VIPGSGRSPNRLGRAAARPRKGGRRRPHAPGPTVIPSLFGSAPWLGEPSRVIHPPACPRVTRRRRPRRPVARRRSACGPSLRSACAVARHDAILGPRHPGEWCPANPWSRGPYPGQPFRSPSETVSAKGSTNAKPARGRRRVNPGTRGRGQPERSRSSCVDRGPIARRSSVRQDTVDFVR